MRAYLYPCTRTHADVPPDQQNVVFTLIMLPWSFKLVYGFISDNFPIRGMRRKPYLAGGWLLCR
jgi:BT1 family